jgi:hypothetical protein
LGGSVAVSAASRRIATRISASVQESMAVSLEWRLQGNSLIDTSFSFCISRIRGWWLGSTIHLDVESPVGLVLRVGCDRVEELRPGPTIDTINRIIAYRSCKPEGAIMGTYPTSPIALLSAGSRINLDGPISQQNLLFVKNGQYHPSLGRRMSQHGATEVRWVLMCRQIA